MKKVLTVVATVLAIGTYMLPSAITKADTTSSQALQITATAPGSLLALQPENIRLMRITAYTSLPDETDSTPFITANGTHVHDGIVATNLLPFGTEIQIPSLFGDKIFTVEDRMSPVFKNTIDIWMPTKGKALFFGLNYADVVILSSDKNISEK